MPCRYGAPGPECQCLFPIAEASVFREGIVWIAVEPAFAWLRGSDCGMSAGVCVFAGVLIWRTIAAESHATCLASAQMNPIITGLYTLFTFLSFRLFDRFDCVQMRTSASAHDLGDTLVADELRRDARLM